MFDPERFHYRLVFLAALVGVFDVVAVVVDVTSSRARDADRALVPVAPVKASSPAITARAAVARSEIVAEGGGVPPAGRIERASATQELVRVPAEPQPLLSRVIDALRPGVRHETPLPLVGERSFLFAANTYSVAAGRSVTATLEVFRGNTPVDRRHVPVEVRACRVVRIAHPGSGAIVASLPLNDEGRAGDALAGDGVYSIAFVPSALPALADHEGLVRLDVEIALEPEHAPARGALHFRMARAAPPREL